MVCCCFTCLTGLVGCHYAGFGDLCLVCFYVVGWLFAGICCWFYVLLKV